MKKHILLCMAIACTFFKPALAQIEKGKWIGSLSLNGSKNSTKSIDQNLLVFNGSVSNFTTQVIVSKMITKNWSIGFGLDYFNIRDKQSRPYLAQPLSNKSTSNYLGPIVQLTYYKEPLKNFFISSSLRLSYQFNSYVLKQNYGMPNEIETSQNGNLLNTDFNLLQCSYLLKKKYLISLNVVNFKYINRRLKYPSTINNDYADFIDFSYSLNPFQNGINLSYIF
jgi:hypothetical protein